MIKNRIKELRSSANPKITLKELSEKLREKGLLFTDSQLSQYEQGNRSPRNDDIWRALAEIFDVSVPYLTGFTNIKNEEAKGFNTVEEFEEYRQKIFNNHKYNPHAGAELKQTFGPGKSLKKIEIIETDIKERYKEVANNLVRDLSDENNEKWLEYGRLLIQEQKLKEKL